MLNITNKELLNIITWVRSFKEKEITIVQVIDKKIAIVGGAQAYPTTVAMRGEEDCFAWCIPQPINNTRLLTSGEYGIIPLGKKQILQEDREYITVFFPDVQDYVPIEKFWCHYEIIEEI